MKITLQNARQTIGVFALAALISACATPPTTAPQTEAKPTNEGELVVYTSRAEALFKPVVAEFNKQHSNIKVTVLSGKGGELAAKLIEEKSNPKADLFVNSDILSAQNLAAQQIFQPHLSKAVEAVPTKYRADDGTWTALTLRARVIMYNKDLVKPEELPKSIFDLTQSKWKGQVGATNSTSDAMIANLAALRKTIGAESTEAFVKDLVANGAKFFGGHTDIRKAVGAGELKLGFVNHYYYHLSRVEGAPVGIVYPDQDKLGVYINGTTAGIIKGAKNAESAKKFVDFLLSPDGQKVFAEKNFEYPILTGIALAEGVDPFEKFKANDISFKSIFDELKATKEMAQKAGLP
jgi:iron(III) transport system substrate-binding protein